MSRGGHSGGGGGGSRGGHSSGGSFGGGGYHGGGYHGGPPPHHGGPHYFGGPYHHPYRYHGPMFFFFGRPVYGRGGMVGAVLLLLVCIAIGLGLTIIGASMQTISANDYGQTVGTVVKNDYNYSVEDGDYYYFTTYRYTVNSTTYTQKSEIGWDEPADIGTTETIYYLKSNPQIVTDLDPEEGQSSGKVVLIFVGLIFGVGGLICLIVCISKYRKNKKNSESSEEQTVSQTTASTSEPFTEYSSSSYSLNDNRKVCEYCGTILRTGETKCPGCGARIKK